MRRWRQPWREPSEDSAWPAGTSPHVSSRPSPEAAARARRSSTHGGADHVQPSAGGARPSCRRSCVHTFVPRRADGRGREANDQTFGLCLARADGRMDPASVFVVEDDADLREGVIALLESEGLTAAGARDGHEALRLLCERPVPAVILLDLTMPRMDGWRFRVQQVRADPCHHLLRPLERTGGGRHPRCGRSCHEAAGRRQASHRHRTGRPPLS
jgi:CheY-like chemotaxis protein